MGTLNTVLIASWMRPPSPPWGPAFAGHVGTVDPALRRAGLAVWYLGPHSVQLLDVVERVNLEGDAYDMSRALWFGLCDTPSVLLVERMQTYRGQAGRDAALDKVRDVTKALGAFCKVVQPFTPSAWKGQIPKKVHHERIRAFVPALSAGLGPDGMDAVGLGLFAFGLLGRGGVRL